MTKRTLKIDEVKKKINNNNCKDSIRDDLKMILDSYVKRAQTISFVERGIERLGFGHQTVVSRGVHTELNHVRSRSLSPGGGLGGFGFWPFFPSPSPGLLVPLFILVCIPYPSSTCGINFSKTDTCPISSYPKWLGWL